MRIDFRDGKLALFSIS